MSTATQTKRLPFLKRVKKECKENGAYYILALPGLLALILFSYVPMAGLYIVFERYTYKGGLFGSEFVGLENFKFFFANMDTALRATRNTLVINFAGIILGTVIAVAIAIMLSNITSKFFKTVTQSFMMLPYFISWVVAGMIAYALLNESNGIINNLIVSSGGTPVKWYSNPWVWWPILVITSIWKTAGYNSIIYMSSLSGFDTSYYEAAEIDGASRWQQITKITIPLLKPTIIIMFLLSIGGILSGDISQIMGMTNLSPLLLETTDTINTFVYRTAVKNGQFEAASAVQLYQSLFGFVLVMVSNWMVKKYDPDYSLF